MNICTVLLASTLMVVMPAFAAPAARDHVRVELIAEKTALIPGERNWIGIRLVHQPHWHTYWINPGDSGLPTKLKWRLPATIKASDIAWPAPRRFEVGGLFNFGYAGDVVLPIPLDVARGTKAGTRADLVVDAQWLVCREECVPGKAALKLSLPVAASAQPVARTRKLFAAAHAVQPVASAWSGQARLVDDRVEVSLAGENLPDANGLDAFVVQRQIVGYAPPQVSGSDDRLTLTFARSEYLTAAPVALELILTDGRLQDAHARSVTVPFAASENSSSPRPVNP